MPTPMWPSVFPQWNCSARPEVYLFLLSIFMYTAPCFWNDVRTSAEGDCVSKFRRKEEGGVQVGWRKEQTRKPMKE